MAVTGTPGNLPAGIGTLRVTAEGLVGLFDSEDPDSRPDSRTMLGQVEFTPSVSGPLVAIGEDPKVFLTLYPATCRFDEDGVLRPPADGVSGGIDPSGDIIMVAPDQPDQLSVWGWTWTARFRPGQGQSWAPFEVRFGGAPGDVVNLAEGFLAARSASSGSAALTVWYAETEAEGIPSLARVGDYIYVHETGMLYRLEED